jgi:hypothetical protein
MFQGELMNLTAMECCHQKTSNLGQQKAEMQLEKLVLPVVLLLQFVGGSSDERDTGLQELQDEKAVEEYRMVLHSVKEHQADYYCQSLQPVA